MGAGNRGWKSVAGRQVGAGIDLVSPIPGQWLWLFPATYLAHILEEAFAGERFHIWIGRIADRRLSFRTFLALNGLFFAAMVIAIIVLQASRAPWLLPALGTLVLVNGVGHLAGTAATRTYSPGLVSGVLLWLPLGLAALLLSWRLLSAITFWYGVAAGFLFSGVVVVLAMISSHKGLPG
jgi:hypothetical protein